MVTGTAPTRDDIIRDARYELHAARRARIAPTETRQIIATFGDVTEDNDRIATLEIRPGMFEGEYQALALRCWGNGHWCRADGQPHFFTDRVPADAAAERWISEGKR